MNRSAEAGQPLTRKRRRLGVRVIASATATWPLDDPGRILIGTMNGDVHWFLDLNPAPDGTTGKVVRCDPECTTRDVLAPSWTQLLHRYADDLHHHATDPATSALDIDPEIGPACELGATSPFKNTRPAQPGSDTSPRPIDMPDRRRSRPWLGTNPVRMLLRVDRGHLVPIKEAPKPQRWTGHEGDSVEIVINRRTIQSR